ncbi:MAG: aminotransferase class V-fold PLP-dependent enzyme [Pirellulaceae bacterium]|nr:aminotransferase class V-fold PLP-dependent enzyme [Planctomycetales bacterium]
MSTSKRVYLDNAATTWPKPEAVYDAVGDYMRNLGGAAGRGAHDAAGQANQLIDLCRVRLSQLLEAESAERIALLFSATDALNTALHGAIHAGDHVVTTAIEHNSVLRPLAELAVRHGVESTVVPCDAEGRIDPSALKEALRPATRLVVCSHASNVVGTKQRLSDIVDVAHDAGAMVLIDAAQSVGQVPISVRDVPVDLLAASGHKSLLGPLGTGFLYVRPGMEDRLQSLRQGGTGTDSSSSRHPERMPEKLEAGNHNVPGLAGLAAALDYLQQYDIAQVARHHQSLMQDLREKLLAIPGVTIYGPSRVEDCVGVVSINVTGWDCHELASVLQTAFQIQARAGLHCAPRIHPYIGSDKDGGTLRISVGVFTTRDDIDTAVHAIRSVA